MIIFWHIKIFMGISFKDDKKNSHFKTTIELNFDQFLHLTHSYVNFTVFPLNNCPN